MSAMKGLGLYFLDGCKAVARGTVVAAKATATGAKWVASSTAAQAVKNAAVSGVQTLAARAEREKLEAAQKAKEEEKKHQEVLSTLGKTDLVDRIMEDLR